MSYFMGRWDAREIREENAEERAELMESGDTSFRLACWYLEKSRQYGDKANALFRRANQIRNGRGQR